MFVENGPFNADYDWGLWLASLFFWRPLAMALAALKGAWPSRPELKLVLSGVAGYTLLMAFVAPTNLKQQLAPVRLRLERVLLKIRQGGLLSFT